MRHVKTSIGRCSCGWVVPKEYLPVGEAGLVDVIVVEQVTFLHVAVSNLFSGVGR